jgi:alkylation response protein AidB-like acyl-CoA dehydrogenase
MLAADADAALARVLDEARVALAAEMGGGAARVLEMTVEHARTRRQFDRPIGSFQAVQHACADMLVGVECARIAALGAAWAADHAAPEAALEAAVAKATASDAYRAVTTKAIQLHGGIGFTWEHDCHLYYRRATASAAAFGDATFCRELVAQQLAL